MRLSSSVAIACGLAVAFAPGLGNVAGAVTAKVPAAHAATVKSPDANCTLSPSLDYSGGEQSSCIAVGAKLSRVPSIGQTAALKITVKAARAESDTRVTIDLPSTLRFADGTRTFAAVNGAGRVARADAAAFGLTAGASRSFTRVVKAVGAGFGEVAVTATDRLSSTRTDGGTSSVFLTTGATAHASFLGRAKSTKPGAVTATHGPLGGPEAPAPAKVTNLPAPAHPAMQRAVRAGAQAPGTSCATGSWHFTDQNGVYRPEHNATVKVIRSSTTVATGFTGGDGSYSLCWSTGGAAQTVYVQFVESNGAWELVDSSGSNTPVFSTGIQTIADGATGDFGSVEPADSTQMRGLHAYQEADDEWQWMFAFTSYSGGCWSPFESTCRELVIHWQSDSTTGTFWNSSGAYLLAGSPDTLDEPVHEYGHALMYNLYGQTFPATTNCSTHDLFVTSSTTCAMTEGWADWVATSVYNNMVWTYNGGFTRNMDVTWNEGLGYPDGDQVEARVVQAMRSLTDGVKTPWDNDPGEGAGTNDNRNFFADLFHGEPNTFASFWSERGTLGQDTSQTALSALYQGTIDYGFRNPLSDYNGVHFPEAVPDHRYSFTTTTGYWSVVAEKPDVGTDTDLAIYSDFNQTSALASSAFGGTTTDFVAINSNSGEEPLTTYYPLVHQFAGTGGYTIESAQGSNALSTGLSSPDMFANQPVRVWDSFQSVSVPVFYRAVPTGSTQDLQLAALPAGNAILSRASAISGADAGAGNAATLTYTPSVTGWAGIVLLNNSLSNGVVNVYADTTAPTGTVSINGGAATTADPSVTLTLSAADAQTGLLAMQVSTDGVFDTEPVVAYSTTASATLPGPNNGTKTVYVRYENNAGMWSAPVTDTIALHAAPIISSIVPTSGPKAGGNTVTLNGSFLGSVTAVKFGTKAATSFTVVSNTKITAVAPAEAVGTVNVRATSSFGTSPATAANRYKFVNRPTITSVTPASGPKAGGTTVTIVGTNLLGATAVKFGTKAAASFTVVSNTKITAVSPKEPAAQINVQVTAPGGVTAVSAGDKFKFV